jgi:ribosomal protein L13E
LRNLLEQAARDRGLAGADLAGEQYEPAFATDPVEQMRQGVLVALAHVKVTRRWRDGERGFSEAEVIQIHRGHGVAAELKSLCLIAEALQACRWSKQATG